MCTVAAFGRGNKGIISSNNNQCLVNLALMRHSLMAMETGAVDLG